MKLIRGYFLKKISQAILLPIAVLVISGCSNNSNEHHSNSGNNQSSQTENNEQQQNQDELNGDSESEDFDNDKEDENLSTDNNKKDDESDSKQDEQGEETSENINEEEQEEKNEEEETSEKEKESEDDENKDGGDSSDHEETEDKPKYSTNPLLEDKFIYQHHFNAVGDIYTAWNDYRGDEVTLAVIDSNFDVNHPEFFYSDGKSKVLDTSASFTYNGSKVTKQVGKQYLGNKNGDAHGTFCATVAAGSVTGKGTVGIAPNSNLLLLNVDKKPKSICEAFKYAADNGAKVITISIGSYYDYDGDLVNDGSDLSKVFDESLSYCYSKGVVVVSAAGNGGYEGRETEYTYPGSCNHVIGVGGLKYDSETKVWDKSSYNSSSQYVFCDIFAPSDNIYSGASFNGVQYGGGWEGTSFASPMVAGAACLYFQKYPTRSVVEFERDLYASAKSIASDNAGIYTAKGRLDIGALLDVKAEGEVSISFNVTNKNWLKDSACSYVYLKGTNSSISDKKFKYTGEFTVDLAKYRKITFVRSSVTGDDWNARSLSYLTSVFKTYKTVNVTTSSNDIWYDTYGPVSSYLS
ncbi:MAG: S8 family serine peptidase, partial [Kurthia sp.]|nr:S8 family serine peptidase [Candidatus Kurthia equi]